MRLRLDPWLPQSHSKKAELEWEPSLQWVLELGHLAGTVLWVLPEAVLSGPQGFFQSPDMHGAGSGALGIHVLF